MLEEEEKETKDTACDKRAASGVKGRWMVQPNQGRMLKQQQFGPIIPKKSDKSNENQAFPGDHSSIVCVNALDPIVAII